MRSLSDAELPRRLFASLNQSRWDEVDLISVIAEVDARKLYAREAKPSMFQYCTGVLHLSEQEAYLRITVARASREHPQILSMLRDGRLHLSGVARLTKHLTPENRDEVLERAVHRSRRQIEELVAELEPRPEAPPTIRKLPPPRAVSSPAVTVNSGARPPDTTAGPGRVEPPTPELCPDRVPAPPSARPAPPATLQPVARDLYRVQFTASVELREKLERLQALMRSSVPDGDLGRLIEAAVTEKLERLEARRFGKTRTPRKTLQETDTTPSSRHIPAAVRRAVHERAGGRCTYRDKRGRRCTARERLEFHHHDQPFGKGGEHSLRNIRLMCKTHNQLLAEEEYGEEKMAGFRRGGSGPGATSRVAKGRASRNDSRLGPAYSTRGGP